MVPNYEKSSEVHGFGDDPSFIQVYNDSGSTIANGAIKAIAPKWISGVGTVFVPIALATNDADSNIVGIVNNKASTGIATSTYGTMQVKGLYGSLADAYGVSTSGSVAANAQLEILTTATAFIDAGAVGGAVVVSEAVAVAVELVTTNVWSVYLLGKLSAIKGS